jgi:hypothetical protein
VTTKFIILDAKTPKNSVGVFSAFLATQYGEGPLKLRRWLIKPGETFTRYTELVEFEDEKCTYTIDAKSAGVIKEIICQPGEIINDRVILATYEPKIDWRFAKTYLIDLFDDFLIRPISELPKKIFNLLGLLVWVILPFIFVVPVFYFYNSNKDTCEGWFGSECETVSAITVDIMDLPTDLMELPTPPPPKKTNQEKQKPRHPTDLDKIESALRSCWVLPPRISKKLQAVYVELNLNAEGTLSDYALRTVTFDDDDPLAKQHAILVLSVHRAVKKCWKKIAGPGLALDKVVLEFDISKGVSHSGALEPSAVFPRTCSISLKSILFNKGQCNVAWFKSTGLSMSGASNCQDDFEEVSLMVERLATGGMLSVSAKKPEGMSVILAMPQFTGSEKQTISFPEFSDGKYRGDHKGMTVTIDFENRSELVMSDNDGALKFDMDCEQ